MARGRRTSLTIRLTPAERLTLLAWQRSTTIPAGLARRARLLLLLADGMTITQAATTTKPIAKRASDVIATVAAIPPTAM